MDGIISQFFLSLYFYFQFPIAKTAKKLSQNFTRNLTGGAAILAHSTISYFAVATAGFLNSYCMRMGEMRKGIKVVDKDGNDMGISQICAEKAVI